MQQSLGVGVVVLGLLVGRIHPQGVLVAFERLRVFFLLELGVAQVVESLGPFLVGAGGVCGDAFERLGRLFVFFGAVKGASQVVGGLEVFGGRFERLRVSFDAAVVPLLREIPVALRTRLRSGYFWAEALPIPNNRVMNISRILFGMACRMLLGVVLFSASSAISAGLVSSTNSRRSGSCLRWSSLRAGLWRFHQVGVPEDRLQVHDAFCGRS